jgi:pimeloyl-ACP methyl ester carboxylesterase
MSDLLSPSLDRAGGVADRDPGTTSRLLLSLSDADKESHALVCEAVAEFDMLGVLGETQVPRLVAAGRMDVVVPPETAEQVATAAGAALAVLAGCGHLPPAEDPAAVARLLTSVAEEQVHG